ncbi:hypothetical protein Tco_0348379 [Tanacetum coccineum]
MSLRLLLPLRLLPSGRMLTRRERTLFTLRIWSTTRKAVRRRPKVEDLVAGRQAMYNDLTNLICDYRALLEIPKVATSQDRDFQDTLDAERLIYNSIIHGPYVRRMIPELGDPDREVPVAETFHEQNHDKLTDKEVKQMKANDQAIQTILMGLP